MLFLHLFFSSLFLFLFLFSFYLIHFLVSSVFHIFSSLHFKPPSFLFTLFPFVVSFHIFLICFLSDWNLYVSVSHFWIWLSCWAFIQLSLPFTVSLSAPVWSRFLVLLVYFVTISPDPVNEPSALCIMVHHCSTPRTPVLCEISHIFSRMWEMVFFII